MRTRLYTWSAALESRRIYHIARINYARPIQTTWLTNLLCAGNSNAIDERANYSIAKEPLGRVYTPRAVYIYVCIYMFRT